MNTIYTIGHSTRSIEFFVELLLFYKIQVLVDVRAYPGSKRYPHFNKENLEKDLPKSGIRYVHMPELGGRRKPLPDSKNEVWKNPMFRGYADYMETEEFKAAIEKLKDTAGKETTCIMCSEAVWWRCHRSLIADYLKKDGWEVLHIMEKNKLQTHPYTAPMREMQSRLDF